MKAILKSILIIGVSVYTPIVFSIDQIDLSQPISLSTQTPDFNGAYKTKIVGTSNGVLVVVYGDIVEDNPQHYVFDTKDSNERPARDVFISVCDSANNDCSANNNWSEPINISNTALLTSIETDWKGDSTRNAYYGDSDNPHIFASGDHVVVTWGDKYCPGGQQRSVTYLEFDGREIPMSCLYAAHSSQDYHVSNGWTIDRLSDGSRDVKQDNSKGISSGVWAIVWQEDPLGLQPGEAEGPGEGSSGAKVSHGTDIWYSYTSNVSTAVGNIGVWTTPVRITDNHTGYGLPGSFNPLKTIAGNPVDPSQIDKGIVGASRANLQVVGGSNPPTTVIAYEETKGSQGLDEGKFLRYHEFPYNSPPINANDKAGCIVSDPAENARRARFVAQTNAASGSGIRLALFWRQGLYRQGGPADIMMRIGYKSQAASSTGLKTTDLDPPVDPDCFALDYATAIELTHTPPLNISSNTPVATEDNLSDTTETNSLENARAHRAVLRANDLYVGYIYTDDWAVAETTDLANYNFYVRRFNATNGVWSVPVNLSNITDTTINVLEPRLIGTPGNGPGCTDSNNITNPENCQDKDVVIAAWGTETNFYAQIGGREYLDVFITRTTDRGLHFEPVVTLAGGPNAQGESQIRVTPDGNRIFAVWNETVNGQTDGMFSLGAPITLLSDMDLTVTSSPASVYAGSDIDIAYNVQNLGPDKAYDLHLTIQLPASVQFSSASDSCEHNAGIVNCQLGDMDSDSSVPILLSVRSTTVESLTFDALVSSDVLDDPNHDNNQVQSLVHVTMASDIGISVLSDATNVAVGDIALLTYKVQNSGPSQAEGVTLRHVLPVGATFVSSEPAFCSSNTSEVICNLGTLVSGNNSVVKFNFRIDVAQTVSFTANASAIQFDPDQTNNQASLDVTGIPHADIGVSVRTSHNSLERGQHAIVSIVLTNHGPQTANTVTLAFSTPPGWKQSALNISIGSCHVSGTDYSCDIGSLDVGASSIVELDGTVDGAGTATFQASGAATEDDPNNTNNQTSAGINFTEPEDKNTFEQIFGCSLNRLARNGTMFDPTLLAIVLIAVFNLAARKYLKQKKCQR